MLKAGFAKGRRNAPGSTEGETEHCLAKEAGAGSIRLREFPLQNGVLIGTN